VHTHLLIERGIYLMESLDLEEIARDRVYEFCFVVAPLPMVGATGSPVRPLAITVA
jgi:kynurenine formamidase